MQIESPPPEIIKEVLVILSKTIKKQKRDLWELVNIETPDKKKAFVQVEILLSLKEMNKILKNPKNELLKKEIDGKILSFKQNLCYIKERNVSINLPKDFSDLLEKNNDPNDEKRKNWSPEELTDYLDEFITKKEIQLDVEEEEKNEIIEEKNEENIEEWDDASNIDDDIMVVNDEEMKVLDDEMFNKEEIKNEEENTIIDESDKLFKFHQDFALGVNFNPNDPSIFCSVSGDSLAALWDINKKVPHLILKGHTDTINFCNYNYDGSLLATGSLDGSIRIWEANTGKLKHILEGPSDEIRFVDWHKKGNAILAGSADNTVWLWNANNKEFMHIFQGHSAAVTAGGFTPDGHHAVSTSEDKTLRVWNPKNGNAIHKISGYGFHADIITCLAFHPSLPVALTGSADNTACLSNYSSGKVLGRTLEHLDGVESVIFSKDLDVFFTGSIDGHIRIFDSDRFLLKDDINLESGITKINFDPNDPYLVIASTFEGKIFKFDQRKKAADLKFYTFPSTVHDFALNNKSEIVCACEDGVIRYLNLKK